MKRLLTWFERKKLKTEGTDLDQPQVLVSNFSPLNRLEQLLIDAAYDPEVRAAFELCFLEHELLLAIRDDGQEAGLQADTNQEFCVYMLEADDGILYPAAFTAVERGYDSFGPDTTMAQMSGRDLLEMISSSGVWLNASSAFGVLWTGEDVRRILSQ